MRRAGWVYLIAAHVGVAFLLGALPPARRATPASLDFAALAARPPVERCAVAGLRCSRASASASRPGVVPLARLAARGARGGAVARVGADVRRADQDGRLRHPARADFPAARRRGGARCCIALGARRRRSLGISLALYQRDSSACSRTRASRTSASSCSGSGVGFWGAQTRTCRGSRRSASAVASCTSGTTRS